MDLKSLLLPERVVSFDYPGCPGLVFELTYLSKDELIKLQRSCTSKKIDHKTRGTIDSFDDEKFLELYVEKILRGWKGFKLAYLKEMVLIDTSDINEDEELPFSKDQALLLMKSSSILDNWVSEQIGDLGKFSVSKLVKNTKESKPTSNSAAKV
jgi:hypothetical protein